MANCLGSGVAVLSCGSSVGALKSCIIPGQDLSRLSADSQMSPIAFKKSSHAAIG